MGALDYLRSFGFRNPKAELWNGMIDEVRKRLPHSVDIPGDAPPVSHPWQTSAERWEQAVGIATDRAWRVDVEPGWVNDEPATIPYLRAGDPRGWVAPDGYPAATAGGYVGRLLHEVDPPFLTIASPERDGSGEWEFVPEDRRRDYFREFHPDTLVYRATVLVSASPSFNTQFTPVVPGGPALGNFRVACGRPPPTLLAASGGWIELAKLWLVREATRRDPAEDEMLVEQRVFFDLWTLVAQAAVNLGAPVGIPSYGGLGGGFVDAIGNQLAALNAILLAAIQANLNSEARRGASVEFWNV